MGQGVLRGNQKVFLGEERSHLARAGLQGETGWKPVFWQKEKLCASWQKSWVPAELGTPECGLVPPGQGAAGAGARRPRQPPGPLRWHRGPLPPPNGVPGERGGGSPFPGPSSPVGWALAAVGVQVTRGLHPPCGPEQREHRLGAAGWGGTRPSAMRGN